MPLQLLLTIDVRYLRSIILCPVFFVSFAIDLRSIELLSEGMDGFGVAVVVVGSVIIRVTGTIGIFVRMPGVPLTIVWIGVWLTVVAAVESVMKKFPPIFRIVRICWAGASGVCSCFTTIFGCDIIIGVDMVCTLENGVAVGCGIQIGFECVAGVDGDKVGDGIIIGGVG